MESKKSSPREDTLLQGNRNRIRPTFAPPTYSQVVGEIRQAKRESTDPCDYINRVLKWVCCGVICCGGFCIVFYTTVCIIIPIICLAIGAVHYNDCPIQRLIPVFLIVTGVLGILKAIFGCVDICCVNRDKHGAVEREVRHYFVDGIVSIFMVLWFIAGSVWTFSIYKTVQYNDPSNTSTFCEETTYTFTFAVLILTYVIMALCLLLFLVLFCVVYCVFVEPDEEDVADVPVVAAEEKAVIENETEDNIEVDMAHE